MKAREFLFVEGTCNSTLRAQRFPNLRICSGRRVACEGNIVAAGTAASTEGKRITRSTFEGTAFGLGAQRPKP